MKKLIYMAIVASLAFASCKKKDNKADEDTNPPANSADSAGISTSKTIGSGNYFGTWSKDAQITVNGTIKVPAGKTLVIEEGVKIMFSDSTNEFLVFGNLHCKGVAGNMVKFTVTDSRRPAATVNFPRLWGGILFDRSAQELLMLYTQIEYTGSTLTENSQSVKLGFYKAEAGERDPAINFRNALDGKVVIRNCIFNNIGEDCLYIEGGKLIIDHNMIYTQGADNGDAINLKAGNIADVSYNLIYNPNQNGLKWSNSGDRSPNTNAYGYNNTIVNSGWRYPTTKGGGIWLEKNVLASIYNTMYVNSRFGLKIDAAATKPGVKFDYTWYYGQDQATVDGFQTTPSATSGVLGGPNDINSTVVGANDPKFVNYDLSNPKANATFNTTWNFRLQTGSPALTAGTTSFTPHFITSGITIGGVEYKSPVPSAYIGAFGTNN
jgi:hypothetical protein